MSARERGRSEIHALALRFAEGERDAFDPLFDALHPIVRQFTGRTLGPADADDAAQEAMVKVFARIAELDPAREVIAWSLGIAAYEVLTVRRRRTRRRETPLPDASALPPLPAPSPEDSVAQGEQIELLTELVGTLGENEREQIEAELRGEIARGARDRKRRWRALDRLRRFWRTSHG